MAETSQKVEVLPGQHKMVVEIYWAKTYPGFLFYALYEEGVLEYQEFELNGEAGHEYKIVAKK